MPEPDQPPALPDTRPNQSRIPARNLSALTMAPGKWGGDQNAFMKEMMKGSELAEEWIARTRFSTERDVKGFVQRFVTWQHWNLLRIDMMQAEWVYATAMIALKGQGRKEAVEVMVAQRDLERSKMNSGFMGNAMARKEENEGKTPGN